MLTRNAYLVVGHSLSVTQASSAFAAKNDTVSHIGMDGHLSMQQHCAAFEQPVYSVGEWLLKPLYCGLSKLLVLVGFLLIIDCSHSLSDFLTNLLATRTRGSTWRRGVCIFFSCSLGCDSSSLLIAMLSKLDLCMVLAGSVCT